MEHRKRHAMQHKVELSTLLKLTLAIMKKKHSQHQVNNRQSIAKALAEEALEVLEESDRQVVFKNKPKHNQVLNYSKKALAVNQ